MNRYLLELIIIVCAIPLPMTVFGQLRPSNGDLQDMTHYVNDFINFSTPNTRIVTDYEQLCPKNHLCTKFYDTIPDIQESCCEKCSCSSACYADGNCCPDVLEYLNNTRLNYTCAYMQLLDISKSNITFRSTQMVTKCPENFKDKQIRANCENHHTYPNSTENFIKLHIPITSTTTLYRNTNCAICNDFYPSEVDFLTTRLECEGKSRVYFESVGELLDKLPHTGCNLVYTRGENDFKTPMTKCDWGHISYCNQTGKMKSYDKHLDHMCESFSSVYDLTYRNVFCYLCNDPDVENTNRMSCDTDKRKHPYNFMSFSAILDFHITLSEMNKRVGNADDICEDAPDQFHDKYTNRCQRITCPSNSVLSNDTCISILSEETRATYDLFLEIPSGESNFARILGIPNTQNTDILQTFDHVIGNNGYVCFVTMFNLVRGPKIIIHLNVGTYNVNQFEFVRKCLEIENYNVTLIGSSQEFRAKITSQISYSPHQEKNKRIYIDVISETIPIETHYLDMSNDRHCFGQFRNTLVEPITVCPRLILEESLFDNKSHDKICITELDFCAYDGHFKRDGDTFMVCSEGYMEKMVSFVRDLNVTSKCPSHSVNDPKNLITLVISCISLSCLLSTVIVYCACPPLRTIPGKNNLFLSLTLFFAQAVYTFGIGQVQLGVGCQIIGALIHYCWLSCLLWMNACSIHMFRVFAITRTSVPKNETIVYKYALYCMGTPLIFVGITILYSWQIYGDYGYGGDCTCYIISTTLQIAAFGVPIVVIVLANIVLFVITIVKIHRIKSLDTKSSDSSSNIKNYFKLSTLTGATWVWGFLYSFTKYEPFAYLFITHNMGQGFLIFAAFVCNRRTFDLIFKRSTAEGSQASNKSNSQTVSTRSRSLYIPQN